MGEGQHLRRRCGWQRQVSNQQARECQHHQLQHHVNSAHCTHNAEMKHESNRLPTVLQKKAELGEGALCTAITRHPSAPAAQGLPVTDTLGAGVVSPDNDKHVLKVRADGFRAERLCPRLLENYRHNVISNVPLPQELQENKQAPS